ncbi:hypothetical protein EOM57_00365 [Candidatus Saccharibacteria bacterium]|nr:hypothetical protein [Candidatus Saccharibacteria bacterium]
MKRQATYYIIAAFLSVIAGTFIFTDKSDGTIIVLPPEILISKSYTCDYVGHDTKGYLGWPFASIASMDNQSCGGNSAVIYEIIYPLGVLANSFLGLIVYFVIKRIMKHLNVRSQP